MGGGEGLLANALAKLWKALLSRPRQFPDSFWALHSAANLYALAR